MIKLSTVTFSLWSWISSKKIKNKSKVVKMSLLFTYFSHILQLSKPHLKKFNDKSKKEDLQLNQSLSFPSMTVIIGFS